MSISINYLGHSCFKIKSKDAVVITDPFDASIGFSMGKVEADIVTITHSHHDHNFKEAIVGEKVFFVEGTGEYEVKEVMIHGFDSYHDKSEGKERGVNTIYWMEMEGITLCHLGDLGTSKIDDKVFKEIEGCNVLFIPVGGVFTIGPTEAKELIKKIEPNYVVPMHYKVPKMSDNFDQMATVEEFLNEMGVEIKAMPKLVVSDLSLPEETEVVVLERR